MSKLIPIEKIDGVFDDHERLDEIERTRAALKDDNAYLKITIYGASRNSTDEEIHRDDGGEEVIRALDRYLLAVAQQVDAAIRDAGIEPSIKIAEAQ